MTDSNRPPANPEAVWWLLQRIQDNLDKLDEKWDDNIITLTKVQENMNSVTEKINTVNKLLTIDNGKPSVLTEVREIKASLFALKQDVEALKKASGAVTPEEAKIAKWQTYGKIATLVGAVLPGIISFLHMITA